MLVAVSDTHGSTDHRLTGRTREAVAAADVVVHAGDFTAPSVLDAFRAAADRLVAVHGNADTDAVCDRLPEAAVTEYAGVRIAVTHRRRGGATALSLFGRERAADLVVSGHTHRPHVGGDHPTLLNPGSHADPRGNRPAHTELWPAGAAPPAGADAPAGGSAFAGLFGVVRSPDGDSMERFRVQNGEVG
jgi:putative phosphoesterase